MTVDSTNTKPLDIVGNSVLKPKAILVLGMHRSGTSAITRGLQVFGVDLGERLMPPVSGTNDKGFWEDLDIYALNVELLNSLSHDWSSNSPILEAELSREDLSDLRVRAVELLRQKTQGKAIVGVKDPRFARLLPFWQNVFDHLGIQASYVIAVRHPMSVARSLKVRDGFSAEKSYYLWLGHIIPSILYTEGFSRVVVDYDALVDEPEKQLRRIAERLSLPAPSPADPSLEEFRNEFLAKDLRHTRFQPEDLHLDASVPVEVIEAYALLERLAQDELPIDVPDVHETFTRLDQRLRDFSPALHYMSDLEQQLANMSNTAAERDDQLAQLHAAHEAERQAVADRDGQIASLNQAVTERDGQLAQLQITLEAERQNVADRDGQVESLSQSVSARETEVATLKVEIAGLGNEGARLHNALAMKEEEINAIKNSTSWRITSPMRATRELLSKFLRLPARALYLAEMAIRYVYWHLPISHARRVMLKDFFYARFAFAIRHTRSYQHWLGSRATSDRSVAESKLQNALGANTSQFQKHEGQLNQAQVHRYMCERIAVYTSSLGNYFFHEIRDLLVLGFRGLGLEVEVRDEKDGFVEQCDLHVVLAPHEFFWLGNGERLREQQWPHNIVMVNTEQPSTQWFALAETCFGRARTIWDIDYGSSLAIGGKGYTCEYLPLGYVEGLFGEIENLPDNYGTCYLEDRIRRQSCLQVRWRDRPIDILFVGSLTPRRDTFFTSAAGRLAKHVSYLHLGDPSRPLIPGATTHMDTRTVVGLAQRSKMVLNVHQGSDKYFEWQRVVMHGIWQGALIISETSSDAPPFVANEDYVEAALNEIPDKVDYFLTSEHGKRHAEGTVAHALSTLRHCNVCDTLRYLLVRLYLPAAGEQFWRVRGAGWNAQPGGWQEQPIMRETN